MSIVKALIDRLGGTIKVESTLDEGTDITYQLLFKIDKNASEQSESQNCAGAKNLEGMKILLVEDNEINMEITTELLSSQGVLHVQLRKGDAPMIFKKLDSAQEAIW